MTDTPLVTLITTAGASLSKTLRRSDGGKVDFAHADERITRGTAERRYARTEEELRGLIAGCRRDQAFALGTYASHLADSVQLSTVAKRKAGEIARSREWIDYRAGVAAWVLIDTDFKGCPDELRKKIRTLGGVWPALRTVAPELTSAARVSRASTSAGLYDPAAADDDDDFLSSGGEHNYILIKDGSDSKRFLQALHDLCWYCNFGWHYVSEVGEIHERSIVDRSVWGGERLCFEAPPTLVNLCQDATARQPIAFEGCAIDSSVIAP